MGGPARLNDRDGRKPELSASERSTRGVPDALGAVARSGSGDRVIVEG